MSIPRAALVPLGSLHLLEGVADALEARAVAVSLGDAGPTHLLVVADELSPALAASALAVPGGRLLFGRPDSNRFAERDAPLPEAGGGTAFRLHGFADDFRVDAPSRSLEETLSAAWAVEAGKAAPRGRPAVPIELAPSGDSRPVTGLVVRGGADLEESLSAFPESRFRRVRFVTAGGEAYLCSPEPGPLEGLAGEPFYALDLGGGKSLHLPAGRALAPSFARAWLVEILGPGDLFFWREARIVALKSSDLLPLTRRSWRSCHG
jgi:hypothetical protein